MDAKEHERFNQAGQSVINNLFDQEADQKEQRRRKEAVRRKRNEEERAKQKQEEEARRIQEEKAKLFDKLNKPKVKPATKKPKKATDEAAAADVNNDE